MYSLSKKAGADLDSILDYSILNFGADVMVQYHQSLQKCFETLNENPELGTEVEYIRSDYFRFQHRSHVVFYKNIDQGILIMRILHKSMDVQRYFNR